MIDGKINSQSFGLSLAVAAAIFWGAYSAGVLLLRIIEVYVSGFYGYTDLSGYEWKPEITDFFAGLVAIGLVGGLGGWLIASFYNFLNGIFELKLR